MNRADCESLRPRAGERWAWRPSAKAVTFYEALVLNVGDKSPPRVRIELVENEWQGERRWMSPARLEVRWDERHDYIELDRKLRAVTAWSPSQLDRRTAEHVFIKLIPLEIAEFNADSAGTAVIYDVPTLARISGLTQDNLRAEPAFRHDQELTVPWPATEAIARGVASLHPDVLLTEIEQTERAANLDMLHGVVLTDFDGEDHHLSPEDARQRFEERQKPHLDKLREWIGIERATDLLERRDLLVRLGTVAAIATEALDTLEPTQKRIVARLRKRLDDATRDVNTLPPSG